MPDQPTVSNAFMSFRTNAPQHQQAWMEMVQKLGAACRLDEKTRILAYIAVLSALNMESGIPFHVQQARQAGISREEVISAVLLGLPAAGHRVTQCLPAALQAFDTTPGTGTD